MNTSEPSRLAYGLLSAAEADFGSAVATGLKWMVNTITVSNTDTVPRKYSIKILVSPDSTGDQHYIADEIEILPNKTHLWQGLWMLHEADKFRAWSDSANKVAVRVDGAVVTPV